MDIRSGYYFSKHDTDDKEMLEFIKKYWEEIQKEIQELIYGNARFLILEDLNGFRLILH
jgi:hypothetical protein